MSPTPPRNSKSLRQQSLRQILEENEILSQEEVVERMTGLGFSVTQSSISRDFKELSVSKIDGRYVVPSAVNRFSLSRYVSDTGSAGANLFVIKTQSGWASVVSETMDREGVEGVVGTVAGDNTIFVATADAMVHARIKEFLEKL
ncbi:MAG: hypothetical protein GC165_11795 [Armatimonadetes bacterium]|nr:hypothetical protein [Armatimonadota bacterium]MBS1728197.1 hypothetical protein [Armatimonadota bacterium]